MKKARVAIFFLALIGLAASILLTHLHYKVEKNGFEEKSFCNVSEFIDCDAVVSSRYSSVKTPFLSVPNSELGIIYYLIVMIGLLYASSQGTRPEVQRGTLGFLFLSMIFACAYSVLMAYLSIGVLGVLCVMCLTTYIANFLMLLAFPAALGLRYAEVPSFVGRYVGAIFKPDAEYKPRLPLHLGATLLLAAVGILFFFGLNPAVHRPYIPVPRDLYLKAFHELPVENIDVSGRPFWGNPNAKVKIVEFSDFQCPFCRRAAFTLKPYLKAYKDDVALYFVNYPLDPTCNAAIQHTGHPMACLAAKAGVCAAKQGKFWPYHEKVFENQKRLSRVALLEFAAEEKLDGPAFETCLASDEALEIVKKDADEGTKLEIKGTPAVYINGRFFRDWPDPERVRMIIEAERAN